MIVRVCDELRLDELYDKDSLLNGFLYSNDNLRVYNVMVCYSSVSSLVASKVIGGVETLLE